MEEINKGTADCVYVKTAVTSFCLPSPVVKYLPGELILKFPTFERHLNSSQQANVVKTKLANAKGKGKMWKSRSRHTTVCKNIQMHAEPFWLIIY